MNNHNHNNSESRLNENPFDGIIRRALLHQQNVSVDTARQRSVGSEYRVTTRARDHLARAGIRGAVCEAATES